MKKAVIFVRKSLEEKNESCGLEYQAKMCLNKAKEQGYEVVEVIEEENSAYNKSISERPKLQAMLDMATEKKVNAVICWQQSRLARDMSDIIIISGVLSEAECDIIFRILTSRILNKKELESYIKLLSLGVMKKR